MVANPGKQCKSMTKTATPYRWNPDLARFEWLGGIGWNESWVNDTFIYTITEEIPDEPKLDLAAQLNIEIERNKNLRRDVYDLINQNKELKQRNKELEDEKRYYEGFGKKKHKEKEENYGRQEK